MVFGIFLLSLTHFKTHFLSIKNRFFGEKIAIQTQINGHKFKWPVNFYRERFWHSDFFSYFLNIFFSIKNRFFGEKITTYSKSDRWPQIYMVSQKRNYLTLLSLNYLFPNGDKAILGSYYVLFLKTKNFNNILYF